MRDIAAIVIFEIVPDKRYVTQMTHAESIAILDFGSQYAQLIARRVREKGVYSELVRPTISVAELRKLNPKGQPKNLKWKAKLGGYAYGGPVIAGGRIFVGTNNNRPRDPQITDVREAVA